MIKAKNAVVWFDPDTRQVVVKPLGQGGRYRSWRDPIGAASIEQPCITRSMVVSSMS